MAATERESGILIVGGGIAGLTAAVEALEAGYDVYLVEKGPSLGGRVAQLYRYFPKLCPPDCGLEINFRRLRVSHRHFKIFTQAVVERVSGGPGHFEATLRLEPSYVLTDRCTACNKCAEVCPVERPNPFNMGMDKTRAAYLPRAMALPMKYVIDDKACLGTACAKCVEVCPTDAIDLTMKPRQVTLLVGSIVIATGWRPYDATRLQDLGFGRYPNVITNMMFERLAAPDGPTGGKLSRPSDGRAIHRVAFVQCAGSRDVNHLPYCSSVCCLASLKEATYLRERDPDSEVHIFYIDIRTPGTGEDFLRRVEGDPRVSLVKGKVARVEEDPSTKDLVVYADAMLSGSLAQVTVDLVVLATGMVPNLADATIPGLPLTLDEYGFVTEDPGAGVFVAGVAKRPTDVASSTRDATAAALKATQALSRR